VRPGWKTGLAVALLTPLALLVGAFSYDRLGTFNALVPKDVASRRVATNIAYAQGPRHSLDIYAPVSAGAERPVIVFFYGGSWNSGYRQGYEFAGRALAAQGFVVVIPDYRLVPDVRYPGFLADCASAILWTRAHIGQYGGDGSRIVLAGHSAGAYNAAEVALDPAWLGAQGKAIRGVVGLAGPYDFLPLDVPSTRAAFGQWLRLADTQPVNHVRADAPPMLLLHGLSDTLVRRRNSVNLHAALNAAGGHATLKLYPGIDHIGIMTALSRPYRDAAPVLADVASFAHQVTTVTAP
jgi:acetyl esterase/lipase